jgi:hypothetical protein
MFGMLLAQVLSTTSLPQPAHADPAHWFRSREQIPRPLQFGAEANFRSRYVDTIVDDSGALALGFDCALWMH